MIGAEVRDSCRSSGTGETPQAFTPPDAHRPPRGKQYLVGKPPPLTTWKIGW
ncbi:hypothetical protein KEH51_02790 [[Brevibacterium] frigoritolerans]|uniref:Uncharacterized protein n=1 Tax=Peribacillus frigoritolerans TaxID=450367 RepID=A0A941J206_9BACI|nr:hypothetical protein [Peribacillus frigoritolerans]